MTTFQKLKHEARRAEQRSDWRKAINLYREALRFDERRGGPDELGLYNRIGDLHIRLGEVKQAVECYETAADRYAENQLPTSAVALCNKILRVAPDRTDVFRRLALLHATTGLIAEAQSSLLQYVDRLEAAGELSEALEGVQQFTEATGDDDIRLTIAELLSERGHRSQAEAQIRLAAASARSRGEDVSSMEERLRELGESAEPVFAPMDEPVPEVDPVPTFSEPESPQDPDSEASGIRLDDQIAIAFDARGGPPDGFVPGHVEPPGETLEGLEDLVAAELEEFRIATGAVLERGGSSLHYDLGVAFQAMELDAAAVEELSISMADPSFVRRGAERIVAIFGSSPTAIPAFVAGQDQELESPPVLSEPSGVAPPPMERAEDCVPLDTGPGPEELGEMGTPQQPQVDGHEGSSEESEHPHAVPEASTDPYGGVSLEPDLQALFFRARLAQYQIRKAEDSGLTDHRSHLDLGAAYVEMGLAVESARELTAAASGGGQVATRAVSMLLALARDENTDSELALEILGKLHAHATSDSLADVLEELHERWGDSHPGSGRLAELRGSADAASAVQEEQPELAREPEKPVQKFTPPGAGEPSMAREALDTMPGSLEGDTHEDVLPAGRNPAEAAADLCAEADRLVAAGQEEDASVRLFQALELLEDAHELREAVGVVDRLLALRPDDVVLHHQRAEFALGLNDRSLLVESYMALASSLRRQQAPESARTVYARILDIDPDHSGASQAIASLAERTSTPARPEVDPQVTSDEEIAGADSAVPAEPADFDALLEDLRDPGTGGAVLEGDTQAHFELGVAFKQMEMWEEAIAELEQAVVGREDPRPAWEAMAECCVRAGDRNRALEILREAESHPANLSAPSPMIWYRIALLLEETGDRAGAVERLRRVIAVEPAFMDAAVRLSALSV
ncbi:MAG: hypothetical protein P8125_00870 [Gemmatimonadota bacterium]